MHVITKLKGSQKIITFTVVNKGLNAACYDGLVQILFFSLFFEKMAVHKDALKFPPRNDARLYVTT